MRGSVADQFPWDNGPATSDNSEYNFAAPYKGPDDTAEADLIEALRKTKAFKRLRDISFLGALDYFLVPSGKSGSRRYTRSQHSLGVAALSKAYLDLSGRHTSQQRLTCIAAAILHDIGHAPFSHTLEPIFTEEFGLDHHRASERIITGLVPLGHDVSGVLRSFAIDPLAVVHLLNGGDDLFDHFFSGPINFDTIEGILRARSYLKMQRLGLSPVKVMEAALSRSTSESRHIVDGFWQSKDEMYSVIIRSKRGAFFDALFQAIARHYRSDLVPDDFYTTEAQMFEKLPLLREAVEKENVTDLAVALMPNEVIYQLRNFYIDKSADFNSDQDRQRYRQRKTGSSLTVRDFLRV
jgi:predicted HD phosphohydrolase